jgi:hypothetical protein
MSLEDERSERSDLGPKLPPPRSPMRGGQGGQDGQDGNEDAASEIANQPARRSGLYIALGMIMLLTVLVYLNMG